MMFQQGGALYNSSVTELKFVGDERFAKGLEFWRSLVTEGCMLNPNSRSNHGTVIVSEFYEQKVGMIYTTSSNIVKFTEEAKNAGFEIGVLPFPKQTQFFTNQGGSGIIILDNKPAEEQEAAAASRICCPAGRSDSGISVQKLTVRFIVCAVPVSQTGCAMRKLYS